MERQPNGVEVGDVIVLVRSAELPWPRSLLSALVWQSHEGSRWQVEVRRQGRTIASRPFARRRGAEQARDRLVERLRAPSADEVAYQSLLDAV